MNKNEASELIKDLMKKEGIDCRVSLEQNPFVCAHITPLMERAARSLDLAKDILFLDTSGTINRLLASCRQSVG